MPIFYENKQKEVTEESYYGLPELRKYPLRDKNEVESAIKFFNYVNENNEEKLANNIIHKLEEFQMGNIQIDPNNRILKYLPEAMNEVCIILEDTNKRMKIFNQARSMVEKEIGRKLIIPKKEIEKFKNDPKESICFCFGEEKPEKYCPMVNKVIKPMGGKLSPDNYHTAYLLVKEEVEYQIESVEGEKDSYEHFSSYHLERDYKEPENTCWDEEQYYPDLPSALLSKGRLISGIYYVYTDMKAGKTRFIGTIDIFVKKDQTYEYSWKEKIHEPKNIIENTANGAMVGTGNNIYISGCMKKNTFTNNPKEDVIIVHKDGLNDIFAFAKDGTTIRLQRTIVCETYDLLYTYLFIESEDQIENYYQLIESSCSIHEFYINLIDHKHEQSSFKDDVRFESVTPFTKELEKIQRDIMYEYQLIKPRNNVNNYIIEEVDQTIQSLIDSPYRPGTILPAYPISANRMNTLMVERLETLKRIIPTII
ncbi:MAG: hypothetical protein PHC62_00570 [Candidatus Izemoplasmatales bacterium]|nr:hypothetical protein [Candidatus Izemoplasmatales bacterium]